MTASSGRSNRREHFRNYRDFFSAVAEELPALLPKDLRDYRTAQSGGVFKLWFERRSRHYELWFRNRGLEVAHHLEGSSKRDEEFERILRARLARIRRSLGGDVRLEPFGPGWIHLYEHWRGERKTPELASEAAARLAEYVRTLEPMLRRALAPSD